MSDIVEVARNFLPFAKLTPKTSFFVLRIAATIHRMLLFLNRELLLPYNGCLIFLTENCWQGGEFCDMFSKAMDFRG
jgi:hypothetical protein